MDEQRAKQKQTGIGEENAENAADVPKEDELDDDDDELKKVEGVFPIGIGPDGAPLKRNNSDVMNNFFIQFACKSFTDIEKTVQSINTQDSRRQQRFL